MLLLYSGLAQARPELQFLNCHAVLVLSFFLFSLQAWYMVLSASVEGSESYGGARLEELDSLFHDGYVYFMYAWELT